jgi:hypothetical protein
MLSSVADGYLHVEVQVTQTPKRAGEPCGDVVVSERNEAHTTLVCVDGVGSGMKARIAARMCASRLCGLLQNGFSFRDAFTAVAETMNQWRDPTKPYAAFTVARIRNDGVATSLSYDAPPPLLVSPRQATPLEGKPLRWGKALVTETESQLAPGEGLLLMSDGITQAGIGTQFPTGWGNAGVARYVRNALRSGQAIPQVPRLVHAEAQRLWHTAGDDCTAALAYCRAGRVVTIFTGPPSQEHLDGDAVRQFMELPGTKVVCGGTTAEIVARWLGQQVEVSDDAISMVAPPRYDIAGIDLVTEGAVTLNQTYNLFDADVSQLRDRSGVTALCKVLKSADCVHILYGVTRNAAMDMLCFQQQGILPRHEILRRLVEKLRAAGKLVIVHNI